MRAVRIMAAIALFTGIGLATFDDLIALAIGVQQRNEDHNFLPSDEGISMAYTSTEVQISNTTRLLV